MLKRLVVIVGAMLAFGASGANAQVPLVLGLWHLNLEASKWPFPGGLKSEIRSYVQRNDGYLVVLALRVNGDGSPEFIQVAAKSDGKDYPQYQSVPLAELQIKSTPTPLTYSETIADEYTAAIVAKLNGQVINKGTRRISKDGKTMTLNVVAVRPDGTETPIVLVFDKAK